MIRANHVIRITAAGLILLGTAAFLMQGADRETPGLRPDGSALITTNQRLTPVGVTRRIDGGRPKDLAISSDGTVAVLSTSRINFFKQDGAPDGEIGLQAGALGIAWTPDGKTVYASANNQTIHQIERSESGWRRVAEHKVSAAPAARQSGAPANPQVNGLAMSADGTKLYTALGTRNTVGVFSLPGVKLVSMIPVGAAPYHLCLSKDGRTLVAANRGGKIEKKAGRNNADSAGTRVKVHSKTDAALAGSLTFIDTHSLSSREIPLGRQPSGMAMTDDGRRLYVASSDDDTVRIVDVERRKETAKVDLRPPDDRGFGQIPTACALSPDEKTLYVTCGGANAAAIVGLGEKPRVLGYAPTGWYPIALAQRDGRLIVASSKGIGSRPERPGRGYGVHSSVGTVQFVNLAELRDFAPLTRQVAENNRWGQELPARLGRNPVPIPERVGEPSVFKHVVYIIKENHTYDLDLGDIPEGNGDPRLTIFGEQVTPNGHALAREFVLLDNTYTSGTNSADGHQWVASSIANGYIEQNYNAHIRSYPYDGGDPLAYSPAGFLWTSANSRGKSLRIYGEFVNRPRIVDTESNRPVTWTNLWQDYKSGANKYSITAETDLAALRPFLHPNFIGFPSTVSDQWRADQFLKDLDRFEREGTMPSLCMMLLPNDHTSGTRSGMPTPRAAVADGDLALGRIVDRLSHSRFWKEMLILVIMDDSQMGVDHVDGHRTVAYIASPYTRRKTVISRMYNHTSFARSIGLVLGLPAMNRFDRTADSLAACFTDSPDFTPFTHRPNRIPLDEMNPRPSSLRGEARRLAEASAKLDWSDIDRADAAVVARAMWHATTGGRPFPWQHFSVNPRTDRE